MCWLDWLFESNTGGWILCTFAWLVVTAIVIASWLAITLALTELSKIAQVV